MACSMVFYGLFLRCKYLRLNLQQFTSRENYLHLHQNLPSPGHNLVFFGAPERIIWAQELG